MIRHTMWNYVGLIRSEKRLNRALRILSELHLEITRSENCTMNDAVVGLRNGSLTSLLILESARQTRKSRGCHFRAD